MHGHREARGRLGRSHRKNTTMHAADANVGNRRKIRILLGILRPTLSGERLAKPVKIAYVLPSAAVGGTELHVLTLASRIDRRMFDPLLVCTSSGGALEKAFADADVPVHIMGYEGLTKKPALILPRLFRAWGTIRRFEGILCKERVAILHAFLPEACILGALAGHLARTRAVVLSKRATCEYKKRHPLYARFEDLANLASDAITVNSRAVEIDVRRTERFIGRKMTLVYNGIDAGEEPGPPSPPPSGIHVPPGAALITYVANLREGKAHRCLVDAAKKVVAAFPRARFLFVGEERNEAGGVRERIRMLGLEEKVLLIGRRPDVPAILRASTLVAHPGTEEGFSNAVLEAMAAAVPVVAARAGGNTEAVVDGETGILVPPGDAGGFAAAILRLLGDPSAARAMGEAGRRRVIEWFTVERMMEEVKALYAGVLNHSPGRR